MPDRALITPLAEGSFALALANGVSWARRYLAGPENALLLRAIDDLFARQSYPYIPACPARSFGRRQVYLAHGIARRFAAQNPRRRPCARAAAISRLAMPRPSSRAACRPGAKHAARHPYWCSMACINWPTERRRKSSFCIRSTRCSMLATSWWSRHSSRRDRSALAAGLGQSSVGRFEHIHSKTCRRYAKIDARADGGRARIGDRRRCAFGCWPSDWIRPCPSWPAHCTH